MSLNTNQQFSEGEILKFQSNSGVTYGIYVGNGMKVYLVPDTSSEEFIICLDDVHSYDEIAEKDKDKKPQPLEKILDNSLSYIGCQTNLDNKLFAEMCRYGDVRNAVHQKKGEGQPLMAKTNNKSTKIILEGQIITKKKRNLLTEDITKDRTLESKIEKYNELELEKAEAGDALKYRRSIFKKMEYHHWAVYIGDEHIIHLTGDPNAMNVCDFLCALWYTWTPCVVQCKAKDIAFNNILKVQNKDDIPELGMPMEPTVIVRNAKSKLHENGYSLLFYNCEHFVNKCRYNRRISFQVRELRNIFFFAIFVIIFLIIVCFVFKKIY